jgi:hypothetical protein
MKTSTVVAIAILALAARGGQAQRRDPSFDGPRGAFSFQLSDGEPISFFLEWSRVLELTDSQRERLMEIRRRLRTQNAPHVKQLDSLRELAGVDLTERGRITDEDREALARFERWSKSVTDSIRVNNDAARLEARSLLSDQQWQRADSLVAAVRAGGGRRRPPPPARSPVAPNAETRLWPRG